MLTLALIFALSTNGGKKQLPIDEARTPNNKF